MSLINAELVNALRRRTPANESLVNLLTDIIPISRESAYRRLRGEIPFTLEEAACICKTLNISIDLLIGIEPSNIHAFHLNAIFLKNPVEEYSKMLLNIINGVKSLIAVDPQSISYRACRTLPHEFLYQYRFLSKIYLYVLLHQLHHSFDPDELLEMPIPDDLYPLQKETFNVMQDVDSVLILDRSVFIDYIEIVKYFKELEMFSREEVYQIKSELNMLVDDMEQCATKGSSQSGKRLDVYLCGISFDCSYMYMRGAGYEVSALEVFCIDYLTCEDKSVIEIQKLWIRSLIRFSTLISVSGESERKEFFNKQREYIDSML